MPRCIDEKRKSSRPSTPSPLPSHYIKPISAVGPESPRRRRSPWRRWWWGGANSCTGSIYPPLNLLFMEAGRRWAEGKVGPTSVSLPLPLLFFETRKKERRRSENAQFFSFRNILPPSWWRRLPRGGFEKVFPSAKRPKTGRNKGPSCFPFLLMKEKNRTGAAQMGGKKKNHTTLYCIHVLFTSLDSRAFLSSLILVFSHHE